MDQLPTNQDESYEMSVKAVAASVNANKMTKITLYLIIAFVVTLAGTAVAVVPKVLANNSKTDELNQLQEQIDERSKQLQNTSDSSNI